MFTPSTSAGAVSAPTVNYNGNKAEGFLTNFLGIGTTDNSTYQANIKGNASIVAANTDSRGATGAYTALQIGSGSAQWV